MPNRRRRIDALRSRLIADITPVPRLIVVRSAGHPPGLQRSGPPGSGVAVFVPDPGDTDPAVTARRLAPDALTIVGVDPDCV